MYEYYSLDQDYFRKRLMLLCYYDKYSGVFSDKKIILQNEDFLRFYEKIEHIDEVFPGKIGEFYLFDERGIEKFRKYSFSDRKKTYEITGSCQKTHGKIFSYPENSFSNIEKNNITIYIPHIVNTKPAKK